MSPTLLLRPLSHNCPYARRGVANMSRSLLIVFAYVALLFAGSFPLAAQDLGCNQQSSCDQGDAISECQKFDPLPYNSSLVSITRRVCNLRGPNADGSGYYFMQYWGSNGNAEVGHFVLGDFHFRSTCTSRNVTHPPGDAALWYSEPSTCVSGCRIAGTSFTQTNGGVKVYGMRDRYYTGETCESPGKSDGISPDSGKSEETKPKPNECTALGNGQTACVKPDGDHCATSSTGKTFCWKPNETGEKKDGPDGQRKSEKGQPVLPPLSDDPTKEYQRKEGHQLTSCVNDTCTTYNVTNYRQTGKGESKNSTGDNSADGSGNSSGNGTPGKGSGGGDKEGEGDSATDSGNCEAAPMCTGDTLKCLHLKYTWKNQCNTTKDEIVGGEGCTAVPVCIGKGCKAQEYAALLQQWRSRCAAEDDRAKLASDAAAGAADAAGDNEASAVSDLWKRAPGQDGQGLDRGKLTLGGGELFPAIEIMGTAWAPPAQLYTVLDMIRQMVSAAGVLAAMYILFKK